MKTDTPETDALRHKYAGDPACGDYAYELELTCDKLERERNEARSAIAEINQRLIERQESFQAQLIRIEDGWREKLREKDAQIVALLSALNNLSSRLERAIEEKREIIYWLPDHACSHCVGDTGELVKDDFLCARHAAIKTLSTPAPASTKN
jgi:hypothetical protein